MQHGKRTGQRYDAYDLNIMCYSFSSFEIAKHGSSLAAASYYGDSAAKYLAAHSSSATLDTIIAMLLLSLHEFSMKRGRDSWFHLGKTPPL
jgi:hypothetical protein